MAASTSPDADRLVPLAGGHNFRDLGGYETTDRKRVRWHVLYRSGKLSALTTDDVAHLARKGIRVVCDLRTPQERGREPSVSGFSQAHRDWDYDAGHDRLRAATSAPGATPQHVHAALAAIYQRMPWHFAEMYGSAFNHIIAGDLPMVFHCTAGKDRTGVLAALILRSLCVPEETVLADYMLTDQFLDVEAMVASARPEGAAGFGSIQAMSPEMRVPLMRCNPAYLEGALRAVEARHGSVLGYVEEVLGIDADGVTTLRQRLLEPAE